MKVILQKDVKGTGKAGSIIEVKEGYARNYLFPKQLAILADQAGVNAMNVKAQAEQHKKDMDKKHMQELAAKLEGKNFTVKVKCGENGKLFGSVTSKEIADVMREQNYDIDKKKIVLDEPIKALGKSYLEIKLYPSVSVKVSVTVVAQ
ncbi:MAG: 50S ribosomal protein L9 [Christensenellales bacterium]